MDLRLLELASIAILGIGATWIATRFNIPSILLLLLAGFTAGPLTGLIQPEQIFGDSLFPMVSLAVALILFEGGLQLSLREIRHLEREVAGLVLTGGLVTWALGTLAARYILGFSWPLAILLGAILIVTGPTVILPMLRNMRLSGRIAAVVKWEGIVNDPLGALVAVVVFGVLHAGLLGDAHSGSPAIPFLASLACGLMVGLLAARFLADLLRSYRVPDYLQNPFAFMLILAVYTLCDYVAEESGLLAVTVMGVALANQRRVPIHHLLDFMEDLRVLLIAFLFISLSARVDPATLRAIGWETLAFVLVLVLIVRPLAVYAAALPGHSELKPRQRVLLAALAPRGIVAAAVASLFAMELQAAGWEEAGQLSAVVFVVISGTVLIYGLSSPLLARSLGLASPTGQGILLVGAHDWARPLARELQRSGLRVLLLSNNLDNINRARAEQLEALYARIFSRRALERIDLSGISRMVALTDSDEVNALATLRCQESFGSGQVYAIASEGDDDEDDLLFDPLHGRNFGTRPVSHEYIVERLAAGAELKTLDASLFAAAGKTAVGFAARRPGGPVRILTPYTAPPADDEQVIALHG